jgi:2-phospho-L-lactate guanylyltransferase
MRVVVPFDATTPKTRLAPVLDSDERDALARCMLGDVLACVDTLDAPVEVISTGPLSLAPPLDHVSVRVDDRPLDAVVDDAIADTVGRAGDTLVVVMADLALATPAALTRLVDTEGDVVLVPGRGAGTNALVVRTPAFRTDFHGASFLDHRRAASDVGVTVETVDSARLSTDVDEPADLVEAFVHGGDRTREWLTARFELVADEGAGRVSLARRPDGTG